MTHFWWLLRTRMIKTWSYFPSADRFHKVFFPLLTVSCAMYAAYIANQVFNVQRIAAEKNAEQQKEAAERSKREIDYRIEKMDAQSKELASLSKELVDLKHRLEKQSSDITSQEKRHEELVKVSESRAAFLFHKTATQQGQIQLMIDRIKKESAKDSVLLGPSHSSIARLAILQSKSPIYTPDEQELIRAIVTIELGQHEFLEKSKQHEAERDALYDKAGREHRKAMLNIPNERIQEQIDDHLAELERIRSESWKKYEKAINEPLERVEKAMARVNELSLKMDKMKQKPDE